MNQEESSRRKEVEGRLEQKITDLEAVRISLEEDIRTSTGAEREKNQQLLASVTYLLQQLKLAQVNIQALDSENAGYL